MKNFTKTMLCLSLAALITTTICSTRPISANASTNNIPNCAEILKFNNNENAFSETTPFGSDETTIIDSNNENLDGANENSDTNSGTDMPVAKIIVYGSGKVTTPPDIAYVTIGVESVNSNLQTAIGENSTTIVSIIEHLNSKNIDENDIKTKYYSVYQSRDYSTSEKFQEYHVINTIEYKTYDIENIGETISELTSLGVNRVEDIQFDCSTITNCYKDALRLALEDAKSKAKTFTNKELAIDKISEECVYTCMPYRSVEMLSQNIDSIQNGNIEIEAKILVVFE